MTTPTNCVTTTSRNPSPTLAANRTTHGRTWHSLSTLLVLFFGALLLNSPAQAQFAVGETFNTPTTDFSWTPIGGACLTAGTYSVSSSSTIPGCKGMPYYSATPYANTAADATGSGALRFTAPVLSEFGGLISNFALPNDQGIQIKFVSYIYGGSGTTLGSDGLLFFLINADVYDPTKAVYNPASSYYVSGVTIPNDMGAWGGSLGYDCSNRNNDQADLHPNKATRGYDGMIGAYIGLGIDEKGDFLNGVDNTNTGINGNVIDVPVGNTIGLRGYGSINWFALNSQSPANYPTALSSAQRAQAVQATCKSGTLWNYAPVLTGGSAVNTGISVPNYSYFPQGYKTLTAATPISTINASTRVNAIPIAYNLKVTSDGLLSLSYSYNGGAYQPVLTGQDITKSNGPLPSAFYLGFGGTTGGIGTNFHEISCFAAAPAATSASSAGLNQVLSSKVQTTSQVYFAYYDPTTYAGSLVASSLGINTTTNQVTIATNANWDAACGLTGTNNCGPTGNTVVAVQGPNSRNILSWNGTTGIPFQYASLSATQQAALTAGDTTPSNNRTNYLRGDTSNNITSLGAGLYRRRTSILGDIINSTPTWVGPPEAPYPNTWADSLYSSPVPLENSGQTYGTFASANASRLNVVYVGANDGLLHGFRAGGTDPSTGNLVNSVATPNDGYEVMAYMPSAVINSIHNTTGIGGVELDYSNAQYSHNFYVDATPDTEDLYYSGAWHTWLVGGLGAGGAAIYALDITSASFSESNASSIVKGEWDAAALNKLCGSGSTCGSNLGNTYGTPQIRRLHNGSWGIIFGNGFQSSTGVAGIYIMTLNSSGTPTNVYFLQAPSVSGNGSANGIAYVSPVDLDGDHVTDYVYAGDLYGNIWRFDLTSNLPANWAAPSAPLFSTPNQQPVTTKLLVASIPSSTGPNRVMVSFGTGQQTPFTVVTPTSYVTGQQYLFGIWDWNMVAWNNKGSTLYASLPGPQPNVNFAHLQAQSVTGSYAPNANDDTAVPDAAGNAYRTVSNNTICWSGTTVGTTSCANSAAQFGWYLTLPGTLTYVVQGVSTTTNEQILYNPSLVNGQIIVNTTIPPNSSPLNCTPSNTTGWTYSINISNGGSSSKSVFTDSNNNFNGLFENGVPVSAVALNGTGSVSIVNQNTLVTQTSAGLPVTYGYNPNATAAAKRLTWIQKR